MTNPKIPQHLDRRYKLSANQKETIAGLTSEKVSELAKYYGVSRRTIQFLMYPERKQASLQARKDSGKSYYNKDKQRQADKAVIEYRKQLKERGEL